LTFDSDEEDPEEDAQDWFHDCQVWKNWTQFDDFLLSVAKMGLILVYFYVCDRTNFFMKENK
jgi:hypothetical protein